MVFSINTLASAMSSYGLFLVVCFLSQEFVSVISWVSLANERQCFAQNAGSVTPCYVCIISTLTIQFLRAPKHILFLFYLICILTFQLRQSQW